jgi:RecA-family ATPase/DNA polymerase I-like protein with 3'-5' exonuclease and polymerase domains
MLRESLDPILDCEGTRDAYRLEVDLLPRVHAMRRRGIRVDISAAEQAHDLLLRKRDAMLAQISEQLDASVGMDEINGRKWLIDAFDRLGIKYPLTDKGNPSFKRGKRGWMQYSEHWLPPLIAAADQLDQYGSNFLQTQILDHIENGRVYGEIHPHRSDYGGTRSLRFSYSHPPLQQMPKHDEELAPLIRSVFLPEEGEVWASTDYNQQEFRHVVHFSARHKLTGAAAARDRYINDPSFDIHAYASELTGGKISRQDGKTFNFMTIYGAGPETTSHQVKKSLSETKTLLALYNEKMPFISQLATACKNAAHRDGYFTLFNRARRHFNLWAPGGQYEEGAGPCSREEADLRVRDPSHPWYGKRLWRAETYEALNVLIQSSAAIQTKLWMRDCFREGVVPLLQMHDSLDLSATSPEQAQMVARLGEEVIKLEVPMKVDVKYGRTWGDAKHTWDELHAVTSSRIELVGELPDDRTRAQRESPILSNDSGGAPDSDSDPESNFTPWEGDSEFEKEPPHICIHCKLDPPDGMERVSAYDGAWLHERCEDAFIYARMAEEGMLRADEHEPPQPSPQSPPPQSPPPQSPPPGGNGRGNGFDNFAKEHSRHSSDGNVHGDSGKKHGRLTAQWFYPYLDRSNYLRVDRYDNGERKFYQHHWNGKRWVYGVKGTYAERKIPYRLPELKAALHANPDVEVQLCEGESDADEMARQGFVATTNPGGALSWTPEMTSWLKILGVRRAVIHEDNDGEAQGYKAQKRSALLTKELSDFIKLKIVRYPDVPEGEDVRWWLKHHTKEELEARITAAESAALPFPFINMSIWDTEPVPEQQWIVFGRIPRRQSVIFSGEGGAGKSIIQLHLSAAAVLGRNWLGAATEQGPALFIDCEDDQDVMHYRLAAVVRHFDTCFTDLINGGLHLTSLVGQDTVMATVSRSGIVEPTLLYTRLLQAAGDIKPTMIGIAAAANVFAGDENNRSQVQQFVNLTTRLAIVANGALVLITHPSITGINTGSGLSGSTQWHNAVRARFFLRSPKAEPGEQPNNDLREIEFKKNQYGAMADCIPLRWQDGMFLPVDGVTFDRAEQEARADAVFLELLRRFTTENRYVSSSLGPTYAPTMFAKEETAQSAGVSSTSLAAAMRRLFSAGKIYNESHGKPSRERFHLAIKS